MKAWCWQHPGHGFCVRNISSLTICLYLGEQLVTYLSIGDLLFLVTHAIDHCSYAGPGRESPGQGVRGHGFHITRNIIIIIIIGHFSLFS